MTVPSTAWKEIIGGDEDARYTALAKKLLKIAAPKGRALHFKAHGGFAAELVVAHDVPQWAKAGIFAQPGTYKAYVRFSNGSWRAQNDKRPDVRGIAVKVVGVPGRKLIEGLRDAATQDFLGILTPSLPFQTPEQFVGTVLAGAGSKLLALPRIIKALGFDALKILPRAQKGLATKLASVAEKPYYSAASIRWGDYAAKYAFFPVEPGTAAAQDSFGGELKARLQKTPAIFEMRVQAYVSDEYTPIEDVSKEWLPEHAPWVTVARLTIPQGATPDERVDLMSFDPWHAPEAFRPLGQIMRARLHAYRESVIARGAAPEPTE